MPAFDEAAWFAAQPEPVRQLFQRLHDSGDIARYVEICLGQLRTTAEGGPIINWTNFYGDGEGQIHQDVRTADPYKCHISRSPSCYLP